MSKITIIDSVSYENVCAANFSSQQLESLKYSGSSDLLVDVIYVIVRQMIHGSTVEINKKNINSKKVFALIFDQGLQLIGVNEITLSQLKMISFGEWEEEPLIQAELREGRHCAINGTEYVSAWIDGGIPTWGEEKVGGWVRKDVAFKVEGRRSVWESIPIKTRDGKLDNAVYEKDGKTYLALVRRRRPVFRQLPVIPKWDVGDLPTKFKEVLERFKAPEE